MFRAARSLLMLAALLAATGCAGRSSLDAADFTDVPVRHHIADLPLIEQERYFCGPAALAALLHHHHMPEPQESLAEQVFNARQEGTFQHDMLYALRSRGLMAAPVNNLHDLVTEIAHDNPVLVFQNLALSWVPKWHYAVATGYDLDKQVFYLHGGRAEREEMPFSTFGHTWRRTGYWGYAVTLPPRLPATTDSYTLDGLAARFEELNHPLAAEQSYKALAKRPPPRSQPWFGLGNVYLAQERHAEAETAYRAGLAIEPHNALIANNLAYALAAQDKRVEACAFLNTALHRSEGNEQALAMLRDSRRELCSLL